MHYTWEKLDCKIVTFFNMSVAQRTGMQVLCRQSNIAVNDLIEWMRLLLEVFETAHLSKLYTLTKCVSLIYFYIN